MTVSKTQNDKLSYPSSGHYTHSGEQPSPKSRKGASPPNNLISGGDINRLRFARSGDAARSTPMNFSLKPNIDSRVCTESALAEHVPCGFTSCPVRFEAAFGADWIGLLSTALNKVSAVIYRLWQPRGLHGYTFHTFAYEAALVVAIKRKKKKDPLQVLYVSSSPVLQVRLTSLPTRSS